MLDCLDSEDVSFVVGKWSISKSGKSVVLPDGRKINFKPSENSREDAATYRLVQSAPALFAVSEDYKELIEKPEKCSTAGLNAMLELINAIHFWIDTGEDHKWVDVIERFSNGKNQGND